MYIYLSVLFPFSSFAVSISHEIPQNFTHYFHLHLKHLKHIFNNYFLYHKICLLEYNHFIRLCCFLLYNTVNQQYVSFIPFLLRLPPHQSGSSQSTRLSALCYAAASYQLSILYMVIYICQCYCLSFPHSLLPLLCPQVHSLHLCLYSCSANRFISTIFLPFSRFHLYALIYDIYFSLSDLLHSV